MNQQAPYVVLIVSPSPGVGQTTLAQNLPVYLKGLDEQLPVAYLASDTAATDKVFALPGQKCKVFTAMPPGGSLADVLTLGEFGVEYACTATESDRSAAGCSDVLAVAEYPGILLFDLGVDDPLLPQLLPVIDLLLVPAKDPAEFGKVVALRKLLLAAGGCPEQLWLVPSELGGAGRYQAVAQSPDFFRFAAEERNLLVLDLTLCSDLRVSRQAAALGKPVLTRLPQSPVHFQLRGMAEFILRQRRSEETAKRRVDRMRSRGRLPGRGRLVRLSCPLCERPVLSGQAHYLESLPARRRMLLHSSCLEELLQGTAVGDFLPTATGLLLSPAVFHGGRPGQLSLTALDDDCESLQGESAPVAGNPGWSALFTAATGRCFEELYQDFLLLSAAQPFDRLLSPGWYRSFLSWRGRLRAACREEKIGSGS